LATYVERRQFFTPARRREIARHIGELLIEHFHLPRDTSQDLLLCALYYRAFIADRGDALLEVAPPPPSPVEAARTVFGPPAAAAPGEVGRINIVTEPVSARRRR
jgi:hypothetical protein